MKKWIIILVIVGCAIAVFLYFRNDQAEFVLNGKWKSDIEKTIEFAKEHQEWSPQKEHAFRQLFGHMIIEYRNNKATLTLLSHQVGEGETTVNTEEQILHSNFEVLYQGESSVTLLMHSDRFLAENETLKSVGYEKSSTTKLHFNKDKNQYWVYLGDSGFLDLHGREYFSRIE